MLDLIKDFNGIHTQLFEYNDYTKYSKFSKTFNKLDTCKMFVDSEKSQVTSHKIRLTI